MEILKVVFIAVIGVIIFVYLKSVNSELSNLSLVATGVILLLSVIGYILEAVNLFANLSFNLGLEEGVFKIVIKIIVISYLIEFTENLCTDLNASGIGTKVSLCGKIVILVTAFPIIYNLLTVVTSFIK